MILLKNRHFPKPVALLFSQKSSIFPRKFFVLRSPKNCFKMVLGIFLSDLESL